MVIRKVWFAVSTLFFLVVANGCTGGGPSRPQAEDESRSVENDSNDGLSGESDGKPEMSPEPEDGDVNNPVEDSVINPLKALIGFWMNDDWDDHGDRLAISFKSESENNPAYLDVTFHLVAIDGALSETERGQATIENGLLKISFSSGEPLLRAYSISENEFHLEDKIYHKVTGDVGKLLGQGKLSGRVIFSDDASLPQGADFVPGQVLVSYKANFQKTQVLAEEDYEVIQTLPEVAALLQKKSASTDEDGLKALTLAERVRSLGDGRRWTLRKINQLSLDPRVAFVQPNYIHKLQTIPNDPQYQYQWHYPLIGLPEAWNLTTGNDNTIIAVADTGVRFDHPDLAPRLTNTGYDFLGTSYSGDGDGMDSDPTDTLVDQSSAHGTHVSGTIGAATDNGLGVSGITWKGKIMPLRVCAGKSCLSSDVASAILYAAGLSNSSGKKPVQPAKIINLSLGSPYQDSSIESAISKAIGKGLIVVAAAGNNDSDQIGSPGSAPGVITVGAVNYSGEKTFYSNFGSQIDVVAPGGEDGKNLDGDAFDDEVLSTAWDAVSNTASYSMLQGTSMASPHVAGVVALMQSVNTSLNAAQSLSILQQTSTDLGQAGKDNIYGYGLVNAARAVQKAQGIEQLPAALSIVPDEVRLNSYRKVNQVLVQNAGGGEIHDLSIIVETLVGGEWLHATISSSVVPAVLTIEAVPGNLPNGVYRGTVAVSSSAGEQVVDVTFQMGFATGPSAPVKVQAYDASSGLLIQEAAAQSYDAYQYVFNALPVGFYRLKASTDLNGDGVLCDSVEYCGDYTQPDVEPILVLPNSLIEGIDLQIAPNN